MRNTIIAFYHLLRIFLFYAECSVMEACNDFFISPGRIGLSLVANAPLNDEVDAKTDAAVGIARAFSFISSDKDTRQAFDWLIKVSNAIGPFHLNSYIVAVFGFLCLFACLFF